LRLAPVAVVTRKKPSGAQFRKRRKERAEQADAEQTTRRDLAGGHVPAAAAFRELGTPPSDVLTGTSWAHAAIVKLLHQILTDEVIDETARRKQAMECGRTIGMLAVKGRYEERLEAISRKIYGTRYEPDDGLEPVPAGADREPIEPEKENP
jgi:hypothetical protein